MLYRVYRPQTFADVYGQEHVIQTLTGALISGRVGHAYLFTGPRGTGKTTVARLFAKALNCKKLKKTGDCDNACDSCVALNQGQSLDLIEIDAASNGRVDEIRSLKESAQVASLGGGKKIFIIDEAHMITKEAFNALLKVLEEPPAHVVFILATTEPHKILPTVLSRVQRFDFRRLTTAQVYEKLRMIAQAEKLRVVPEGLEAIARSSDGALRDAEVSLSKIVAMFGTAVVSVEDVHTALGLIPYAYHPEFLGYVGTGNITAALSFIQRLNESGISADYFTGSFIDYVRKVMMHKINPAVLVSFGEALPEHEVALAGTIPGPRLVQILQACINAKLAIKSSPIPHLPLELAVIELIGEK